MHWPRAAAGGLPSERPSGKGHGVRKPQQASQEALDKHAADVALAAKFDELLAAIGHFSVDHEFADDVCLVGMEYTGKPA